MRWVGRAVGLDVHREFCEVAICEDGKTRSASRVPATPDGISALAESLVPSDRVALEVTGSCWEVTRILEPHVDRVVVVSPDDTGDHERAGEDGQARRSSAGDVVGGGELEAVWMPDERCRILRRRLARREQLVRSRTLASISGATVTEPATARATTTAAFTVTLSHASTSTASVDYQTSDGSAQSPQDYLPASGTLTFAPGETTKTINVTVNGDGVNEPFEPRGSGHTAIEQFSVTLTNPTGPVAIGTGTATGTILNNGRT